MIKELIHIPIVGGHGDCPQWVFFAYSQSLVRFN